MENNRAEELLRQILHPNTERKDALALVDELSEGLKKRFTEPKTLADIEERDLYYSEGKIFIDPDGDELILVRALHNDDKAVFLWKTSEGIGRSLVYPKDDWGSFRWTGRNADLTGVIKNGVDI